MDRTDEFMVSASLGDCDFLQRAIGAGIDVNGQDKSNRTALHRAMEGNQRQAALLLLDAGANRYRLSTHGETPIAEARRNGHNALADFVRDYRCNNDESLTSAFQQAACNGDLEALTRLLDKGIDINVRDKAHGRTALHMAALWSRDNSAKFLLASGADAALVDKRGALADRYASEDDIADLIRQHRLKLLAPPSIKHPDDLGGIDVRNKQKLVKSKETGPV